MKTSILLTLLSLIVFNANHLFAADRVVQHNGPAGTYASITAAITAAVDGDNIVINNRTDALPWLENLTINKSLTFVSAVDNVQWWMEGGISVSMAESRVITIVGMRNTGSANYIQKTGTVPVNRTVLNILSSEVAAEISMGAGINLYLGSCKTNSVYFTFGRLIGNDMRYVSCTPDANATEDVNQIIGNRIGYTLNTSTVSGSVALSNNTQYLFFSNNFVRASTYGLQITALKTGTATNRLVNNTVATIASGYIAVFLNFNSGQLFLENNVFCGKTSGNAGINMSPAANSLTTATYNMYYNPVSGGTALSTTLNNFVSTSAEDSNINTFGAFISGAAHIDGGSPLNSFLDLDLSRNDNGAYGGSYSLANFLPFMSNTESSRVNYMNTPRIVNQGGTVNVQVIGYDK